jgi:cytochrome P450
MSVPYLQGMVDVTTWADADAVLRSDDTVQASHRESAAFYGQTLLLLDGEAHARRRRAQNRLFTREVLLRVQTQAVGRAVDRAIDALSRMPREDGEVRADLVGLLDDLLLEVAAAVVGLDGVRTPESVESLRGLVDDLAAAAHVEWTTGDADHILARGLERKRELSEQLYTPAKRRRELLRTRGEARPQDLVSVLLDHPPGEFDVEVRETILYLMASTQTTMHAAPHVLHHLEQWGAGREGDDWRQDAEILTRAANEALRLHPPVPALLREATADHQLPGGLRISSGDRIAVRLAEVNRDRTVFGADADVFDPYRRLPSGVPSHGMSFGGGIHTCIGRGLTVGRLGRVPGPGEPMGMLPQILRSFYGLGMRPDPVSEPEKTPASHQDFYASYPVRFSDLPPGM